MTTPPPLRLAPGILTGLGAPIVLLLGVYLLLAAWDLPRQDLRKDELITSAQIRRDAPDLVRHRLGQGHMPLYFLAAREWVRTFGHTRTALLSFSVLLGAVALLAILALAREMGLGRWAWLAGLVAATHPTFVYYARFARPYAGVMAMSAAGWWLLLRSTRSSDASAYGPMLVLGLVGAAWHVVTAFVWISGVAALLLVPELRRRIRPGLWWTLGGIGAGFLALRIVQQSHGTGLAEGADWLRAPGWRGAVDIAVGFLGARDLHGGAWGLAILILASTGIAAWRAFRRPTGSGPVAAGRYLAIATALAVATVVVVTYTVQPLLRLRYLTFLLPAFAVFPACVVSTWTHRTWHLGLLAVPLVLSGVVAVGVSERRQNGLAEAMRFLDEAYDASEGDVVMALNGPTVEAVRLFSDRGLRAFRGKGKHKDPEMGWAIFARETAGRRRVWVVEFQARGSLLATPEWNERAGPELLNRRFGEVTIRHHRLPHGD